MPGVFMILHMLTPLPGFTPNFLGATSSSQLVWKYHFLEAFWCSPPGQVTVGGGAHSLLNMYHTDNTLSLLMVCLSFPSDNELPEDTAFVHHCTPSTEHRA